MPTLIDRFNAKREQDPATGCHLWTGGCNSRGYGLIWRDGQMVLAHRVSWEIANSRTPAAGLVIDHLCDVKRCVNPAHLRELPNHLNLRRAIPRGDAGTEHRRAIWRRANARRRGNYRYAEGGE
jgi:hypothetical protein